MSNFIMDGRNFHLSTQSSLKVYHNISALNVGLILTKKRSSQDDVKHVKLTTKEWKTLASILPSLVDGALILQSEIKSPARSPVLKESRHIISGRLMTLLSLMHSPSEGAYVVVMLCPYEQREMAHVACPQRGVSLNFDELIGLLEMTPAVNKYLSHTLSSTKIVTLRNESDVVGVQSFVQSFYEDGESRVRIILEKVPPTTSPPASGEEKEGEVVEPRGRGDDSAPDLSTNPSDSSILQTSAVGTPRSPSKSDSSSPTSMTTTTTTTETNLSPPTPTRSLSTETVAGEKKD